MIDAHVWMRRVARVRGEHPYAINAFPADVSDDSIREKVIMTPDAPTNVRVPHARLS